MGGGRYEMDIIKNKMIIITGASRGIGKFLFEHYLNEGQKVIGLYNQTIPDTNLIYYSKVDITRDEDIRCMIEEKSAELKDIILINAAGISYNSFAHKADLDRWREVINVNLVGSFNFVRHLLPIMRQDNFGRIINFASVVAQSGVMGTSAYAASKSALWGMSKALVAENGNKNITINTINPGYFDIGMIGEVPPDALKDIINKIPAKRLGNTLEILSTVNFIISTPYLNGATIDLNGGLV